jgi:hypothetical protein
MTPTRFGGPLVTKELRALLPAWIASMLALCALPLVPAGGLFEGWILVYGLGSIALGAHSIGHEYTYRTLSLLLAQPSHRRRLFLTKLGVLAPMLLTLAATAWTVLFIRGTFQQSSTGGPPLVLLLPTAAALFLAPRLTMMCRSTLAGVVFTVAIAGLVAIPADILAAVIHGTRAPEGAALQGAIFLGGMTAICTIAAVTNGRTFVRLEAIDGAGADVAMPRWLRRTTRVGTRRPLWLLAKKELHLQQMTFVIVALYIAMWVLLSLVKYVRPELREFPLLPITMLYLLILSLLIGSLASAEERHFGTMEWQVLLPMAAWKQWAVKAGMVLGLALVLAIGLPALVAWLNTAGEDARVLPQGWFRYSVIVVVLSASSLYLSSLCSSGVKALVLSFPAVAGGLVFLATLGSAVGWIGVHAGRRTYFVPSGSLVVASAAGLVALLLVFGFANHRSAERRQQVVWRQLILIAAVVTFGVLLQVMFV